MKKYIDTTDLINAYINNSLSKTERLAFENRLKTDDTFKTAYEEQSIFIEGIKRVDLKKEINRAKQNYIRTKWMKYIGVPLSAVLISTLVYHFVFKSDTTQFVEPKIDNTEIELDSIVAETPSAQKKETKTPVLIKKPKVKIDLVEKEVLKEETVIVDNKQNKIKKPISISKGKPKGEKLIPVDPKLVAFFKSVKKEPQIIEVNTEKDFTVTGKEGTVLNIPAKSFVNAETGKLVRGKVNLEVTEYYKLSDMLLANLSTTSNEKILETGGMLNIMANKKGSKLKLKPGKKIKLRFNNKGKRNMQLFLGEDNEHIMNWKLENELTSEFIEEDVEVALNVVENVPIFPGCNIGDNIQKKECMNDKISKFFRKKFNTSIAEELKLTGTHKITIFFKINKNGDIIDAKARAAHTKLAQEAIRLVDLLPKMIPAKQRGKPVRVPYYIPFSFKIGNSILFRRSNVEAMSVKMSKKQIDSFGIEKVNNKDIVRYAFSSRNLGWINCDRFVRMNNRKKYRVKIENFDGADIKLIFKSMNAILPSKNYGEIIDFGWIPGKEEVMLIAIKKKENELYLGVEERKTSDTSDLNFNYKKVSIEELKDTLDQLSTTFD